MIRDVTAHGFRAPAAIGRGVGDTLAIRLPTGGCVVARVSRLDQDDLVCEFIEPLAAAELAGAESADLIWPDDEPREAPNAAERWPLPARAAIAVGGALALWALVATVLR